MSKNILFAYINIYMKQIITRQWQQEINNTTNTSLCKENIKFAKNKALSYAGT
jgi:hypothetical protein